MKSVRRGCNLVDGSTCTLMEYIIAEIVLPSTRSQYLLTNSSVFFQRVSSLHGSRTYTGKVEGSLSFDEWKSSIMSQ